MGEYRENILKALAEHGLSRLPVLYNMSFGHNEPMCILPYGALTELDCTNRALRILEGAVE